LFVSVSSEFTVILDKPKANKKYTSTKPAIPNSILPSILNVLFK